MSQNQQPQTQAEIDSQRSLAIAAYKKEIQFLKVEAEYERLRTEIEENRLKRLMILNKSISLHLEQQELRKQSKEDIPASKDDSGEKLDKETK